MNLVRCLILVFVLLVSNASWSTAQDTTPPVISSVTAFPVMVAAGDKLRVKVVVTDNTQVGAVTADGVPLELTDVNQWESEIPAKADLGENFVAVVAVDTAGNSAVNTDAHYFTATVRGINTNTALMPLANAMASKHLFKVWGRATFIDPGSFWVDDGGAWKVKVFSPEHTVCSGDFVSARGILDGTAAPAVIGDAVYTIHELAPREQITLYNLSVGKDLMVSTSGYLPYPVQYGTKLKLTITSSDPGKVVLSKTPDGEGSASITLTIPGGSSNVPTYYVQSLASSGTVDLVATAPGCLGAVSKVTLAPSGFVIYSPGSINTTSFSGNTAIDIRPARLNPGTLAYSAAQSLRPGLAPISVDVAASGDPIGSITTSPVLFSGVVNSVKTEFDPAESGTATISIGSVAGFTTPSNKQSIVATVTAPDINAFDVNVGKDLQSSVYCNLQTTPPAPVDMTVTVGSDAIATVTTDPALEGSSSVTFTSVGNTSAKTFYVQGRSVGTTTLTVSAPGYNTVQKTITVDPSGFIIYNPSSISTTSFSANTAVDIRSARLNPDTLAYSTAQSLRGGLGEIKVPVAVSDILVGMVIPSEVTFNGNMNTAKTEFDPSGAGTATISVGSVAGFTTPSNKQSIVATVTAPDIYAFDVNVGKDLQSSAYCNLQTTPPAPVDMTVTVGSDAIATITTDPAVEGSSSVTFTSVGNTGAKTFYVQGRSVGTTTLTVSAPGYNTVQKTITVDPSGFVIYNPSSISTTYYSSATSVDIRPARLNPDTLAYSIAQSLRGGLSQVTVTAAVSDLSVGTLTGTVLTFDGNTNTMKTSFVPSSTGTTKISITGPEGFTTPSNKQSIVATVTAPDIYAFDVNVGKDLQSSAYCNLQTTPPAPVDMTVTVGSDAIATITTNPDVEGSKSLTFSSVTNTNSRTFYVQGRGLGTTTLTVSAPGYNTVQKTITVDPSGFVIYNPSSISTTASAVNTNLQIRPARLNPDNYTYSTVQNLRGGIGSVSVSVISSNAGVGVITTSPLLFTSSTTSITTQFDPIAAGSCVVSVEPPAGFSKPTTRQEIDVIVGP